MFTSKPAPVLPEPQKVIDVQVNDVELDSRFIIIDPLPGTLVPPQTKEVYTDELQIRVDEEKQKEVGHKNEDIHP